VITTINQHLKIWDEFNPIELSLDQTQFESFDSNRNLARLGFCKQRIAIKDRWFDVLHPSELVRKRNQKDGYYRAIYIQINFESGEYYVGKSNRPTWSQLQRYQGSGLRFSNKLRHHKHQFVRYFIGTCETAEETERLEASIVDESLLSDEKCLNLVKGGGGISKHPSIAETNEKKRAYMRAHPEQSKPMIEAAKTLFRSGDSPALRTRNLRIKEVMSDQFYRDMFRNRVIHWRENNPDEYAAAKRKSHQTIRTPECQARRRESLKVWIKNNPEQHEAWEEKRKKAVASQEANDKRKASLAAWSEANPEQAHANALKRATAAAAKRSKEILMLDLTTGAVLEKFPSQHAGARWLVENGKAKNVNCVASINAVCLGKRCTTGYGFRKKAYGYGWRFASEMKFEK